MRNFRCAVDDLAAMSPNSCLVSKSPGITVSLAEVPAWAVAFRCSQSRRSAISRDRGSDFGSDASGRVRGIYWRSKTLWCFGIMMRQGEVVVLDVFWRGIDRRWRQGIEVIVGLRSSQATVPAAIAKPKPQRLCDHEDLLFQCLKLHCVLCLQNSILLTS